MGLRNFLLEEGCFKKAFDDFIIKIYSGTAPNSPDDAVSGTLLSTISKASGEVSQGEVSIAKQALIDITVASTGNTVIVAVNGVDYTYTVLAEDDTLLKVARKVALMLSEIPAIEAVALGEANGKLAIRSRIPGLSFTIAKGGGGGGGTATWSLTDNTIANSRSDCCQWGAVADGKISKESNVWSGVNVADGTASYFRAVKSDDTGLASQTALRVQGSVSTPGGGGDIALSSINLKAGATTTIDNLSITFPAS
jgi:hypothetical protein